MSVTNNRVTTPIGVYEVATLLGAKATDVGTVCTSSNVNKWAKYKPQKYASLNPSGDWRIADSDAQYGLKFNRTQPETSPVGTGVTPSTTSMIDLDNYTSGFLYKLITGALADFSYVKPTGGESSPYRLGDFDNYYHAAANPLPQIYESARCDQNATVLTGELDFKSMGTDDNGDYALSLLDFCADNSIPLNQYYVGMVFYNDYHEAFWVTNYDKTDVGRTSKVIIPADFFSKTAKYYVKAFFSEQQLTINSNVDTKLFAIPADGTVLLVKNGEYGYIVSWVYDSTQGKYSITIENSTIDTVTLSGCTIYLSNMPYSNTDTATIGSGESHTYAIFPDPAAEPSPLGGDYFVVTIGGVAYTLYFNTGSRQVIQK